jgi:hypothetical protein
VLLEASAVRECKDRTDPVRLLYVVMTCAKDDLHLVVPQRFFVCRQHAKEIVACRAELFTALESTGQTSM